MNAAKISAAQRGNLATGRIVFLVIAAAAPLAAVVGTVPLALLYGDGAGLPAAFLLGTLVILCFSIGYAAMSRYVVNTGAFFTYIAHAIGKPPAMGAAFLAVLSYTASATGLSGAFGYFVQLVLDSSNIHIAWEWPSALALSIVGTLGYRSIDLSSKVLGWLMAAEFAILVVFVLGVTAHRGAAAFPSVSFTPHAAIAGSLGVGVMFALTNFIGVESAALYSEEAADPARTVGRATLISVISIGVFYVLTAWVIVGAAGPGRIHDEAKNRLGNLVFDQMEMYVSPAAKDVMALFLCTSVLASMLALHNAAARYLFVLGREQVLPDALGRFHPKHFSPHIASLTVSAVCTVVCALFALAGLHPYLTLATCMISLATLGVIALQAMAAVAVVVFFARKGGHRVPLIASAIAVAGLVAAVALAVTHFPQFANTDNPWVLAAPALLPIAVATGVIAAFRLRKRRPEVYATLAASAARESITAEPKPGETSLSN